MRNAVTRERARHSGHRHFLLRKCSLCGVEPSAPRIKQIRLTPFILCSACGSFLSQNDTQSFCSAEWPSANKKRHKCVSFYLAYARVEPQSRSFVGLSASELRRERSRKNNLDIRSNYILTFILTTAFFTVTD